MDNDNQNSASDFAVDSFEIAPGLLIPNKIPFGVRLQLEEVMGKNWPDIDWESGANTAKLVYYLAKHLNNDITEVEVNDKLADADMALLSAVLTEAFTTKDLKNFQRQSKKTEGNLTE